MRLPLVPNAASTVDWLRTVVSSVAAAWSVEHAATGRHDWKWSDVTYNAGRFTASSSTWTVDSADVVTYRYAVLGTKMQLNFRVVNSDVGAGNATLRLALPVGYAIASYSFGVLSYNDAAAGTDIGLIEAVPGARHVALYKRASGNWTSTSSDNTVVQGSIEMEVARD